MIEHEVHVRFLIDDTADLWCECGWSKNVFDFEYDERAAEHLLGAEIDQDVPMMTGRADPPLVSLIKWVPAPDDRPRERRWRLRLFLARRWLRRHWTRK